MTRLYNNISATDMLWLGLIYHFVKEDQNEYSTTKQ